MIGGGIGVAMILYMLFDSNELSKINIPLYSVVLLFFGYSVFCGGLCLESKKTALRYSMINQFLQLISFSISGYCYNYVAGLYLMLLLDLTNYTGISVNFGISKFDLIINGQLQQTYINVNLIAMGLIYWINKIAKNQRTEKGKSN